MGVNRLTRVHLDGVFKGGGNFTKGQIHAFFQPVQRLEPMPFCWKTKRPLAVKQADVKVPRCSIASLMNPKVCVCVRSHVDASTHVRPDGQRDCDAQFALIKRSLLC